MFRFPWGDMHSLNLGWFLQKFNELREDWAAAEAGIDGALDAEIEKAEDALSDVFTARDAAAASATAAAGSASAAGTSATAAQNSATAAGNSATLANNKATAAGLSEAAAAQSAQQAGNSATAAAGSATAAGQSATNAAASETSAGQSATAAAGSATAAGNSATAAAASETAAATSETNAAASAASAAQIIGATLQTPDFGTNFSVEVGKYVIMGNVCILTAEIKCITPTRWFGALPHALAGVPVSLFDKTSPPTTVNGFMAAYNGEIVLSSVEAAKLVADHEYLISFSYIITQ